MRFSEKIESLMRRKAHSNLSLGKALGGVAHTTVARWRAGSKPRGRAAKALADLFDLPVEVLLDDDAPLPHAKEQSPFPHVVEESFVPYAPDPPASSRVLEMFDVPVDLEKFVREHPAQAAGVLHALLTAQRETGKIFAQVRGWERTKKYP